jgi:hypothetical protein
MSRVDSEEASDETRDGSPVPLDRDLHGDLTVPPAPTRNGSLTNAPRVPDVGRASTVRIATSSIRKLCETLGARL